jgi:hypothetical protein
MNTKLYIGNGSTNNITGVGFQPDMTWLKMTSNTDNHTLFDVVRGVTKRIFPNLTQAEGTEATSLTAFNTDGFTLGADGLANGNTEDFASWNWKAGTAVSGNTGGSGSYKTYTGSVNTTSGFSIIKYEGNGTNGMTIPHHLGVAPKMIITKNLSATGDWYTYHEFIGNTKVMLLNTDSAASGADIGFWNNTSPTSSVFSVGGSTAVNGNGNSIIAYCFAEVPGFSKIGVYTGNGNADGPFVYCGFKPTFILMKRNLGNSFDDWFIFDNKRDGFNPNNKKISPNEDVAESSDTGLFDLLSNGFKLRTNNSNNNGDGGNFIYMAFGQTLVGTNNIPNNAF